jgi:hypothetical protein
VDQGLATLLAAIIGAVGAIASATIATRGAIYAARVAKRDIYPGFAAAVIFLLAMVAAFVYIPFVSDYAFWFVAAAYVISATGYKASSIQYYSCFISYSSKDQEFADRIYADLQNNGVRCWFAPHDLKIGDHLLDIPDAAIRVRDKVVLILSENSIASGWVKKEVTAAFGEEERRKTTVLFPVRIDDAVMETNEAWAAQLRHRLIGDFRHWKDYDSYKRSFERVLRDLKQVSEPAK